MLSKIIGISAVLVLFMTPNTAEAHRANKSRAEHRHPQATHATPVIQITVAMLEWVWVDATPHRTAYWNHPHYGKSHRQLHNGPPGPRPHAHAIWVQGHWSGQGRHRHWTPGHWRHNR
jgi:hypothetical protein